jgi:hypothetical protein
MADLPISVRVGAETADAPAGSVTKKFRDMGDGTFAEVMSLGASGASVTLTGSVVLDTFGTLSDAEVTDPAAASATIPALLRGILDLVGRHAGSDGSTTIAAGATAQDLFAGATPANGFEIINPDPSEDLWISDSAAAVINGTGSIRVPANGGSYRTPEAMKPFHKVSAIATTTGHKITARKW